jgi:hypothetical protein
MVNVGIFYDHLEYFMSIWYNLWPFCIIYGHLVYVVCGQLVYISQFGMFGPRKIWQPCSGPNFPKNNFQKRPNFCKWLSVARKTLKELSSTLKLNLCQTEFF